MAGRVTLGTHPGLEGKSSPGSVLLVTITQDELVKDVLCQAAFRGPHVAQVADMVPQLLDELDLLVQVACPQEGAQVGITALSGQLVQVEQALVDALLQVQGVHKGGVICISEVIDLSPCNLDSCLCFLQPSISHDVLCI